MRLKKLEKLKYLIHVTIRSDRPKAEIDAVLVGLLGIFPDLRADVIDPSSPPEDEVGIPELDASRVAGELRVAVEKVARATEVLVQNLDEGCGLQGVGIHVQPPCLPPCQKEINFYPTNSITSDWGKIPSTSRFYIATIRDFQIAFG